MASTADDDEKADLTGSLFIKLPFKRGWSEKYFKLQRNGMLCFADSETASYEKSIALDAVKSFRVLSTNAVNKQSDRKHTFQVVTDSKVFTIAAQHHRQFRQWTTAINDYGFGELIKQGFMFKLGDRRKKWKQRFFRLYDRMKLVYFETEDANAVAKGFIALSSIHGFGHGQEQQYKQKLVIELKTKDRIWALRCATDAEYQEWFAVILRVMNRHSNAEKRKSSPQLLTHASTTNPAEADRSFVFAKQDTLNFDDTDDDVDDQVLAMLPEDGKFKFSSDIEIVEQKTQNTTVGAAVPEHTHTSNNSHDTRASSPSLNPVGTGGMTLAAMLSVNLGTMDVSDLSEYSQYRQIQIQLANAWRDVMADVVIDDKHTLQMHVGTRFCAEQLRELERANTQSFIASIPKIQSREISVSGNSAYSHLLLPATPITPRTFNTYTDEADTFGADFKAADNEEELSASSISEPSEPPAPSPHAATTARPVVDEYKYDAVLKSPRMTQKEAKEQKRRVYDNCQCVQRMLVIMTAYQKWLHFKSAQNEWNDNEGIRGLISILTDYTVRDLLNDYYHIKRFHVESTKHEKKIQDALVMNAVKKMAMLDPDIGSYFDERLELNLRCNAAECVALQRNINECGTSHDLLQRRMEFLMCADTSLAATKQTVEIVTQQLLDMIHCYVFHLSYCIRNVVGDNKHKFVTRNDIDVGGAGGDHDDADEPQLDVEQGSGVEQLPPLSSNMMQRCYSSHCSHIGTKLATKVVHSKNNARYGSLKEELLQSESEHRLSEAEWIVIYYRAELLLSTIESHKIKCKRDTTLAGDKKRVIRKNEFLSTEHIVAVLVYCNYDGVREALHASMRGKRKSSSRAFAFHHLCNTLNVVVHAYGCNSYETFPDDYVETMQSTSVYHCFANPVLFENLNAEFDGVTSMSVVPSVVFTNMHEFKQGIIVEMDLNSSALANYFDVSLYSSFAYECERLYCGDISLSITNIIESDISYSSSSSSSTPHKFHYHSNYLNAMALLRMIIGDANFRKSYYENQTICERLALLISLEINARRRIANAKITQLKDKSLLPEYVAKLFHMFCMNVKGVVVLKVDNILKLAQSRLQSYFLAKSRTDAKQLSLANKVLFQIFPFVTKILCYGIPFNENVVKSFCDFITSKNYTHNLRQISKVNECVFQFDVNEDDKQSHAAQCNAIIDKYQNILKQNDSSWNIGYSVDESKLYFTNKP